MHSKFSSRQCPPLTAPKHRVGLARGGKSYPGGGAGGDEGPHEEEVGGGQSGLHAAALRGRNAQH